MSDKINFFYVGKRLGTIEQLSLESFYRKGYECHLWTYKPIGNVPGYVMKRDASQIMPEPVGSYDPRQVADQFRYLLLSEIGGWWSDLDNVCLKALPMQDYTFSEFQGAVNNNLMRCPAGSEIMQSIAADIRQQPKPLGGWNFDYLADKIREFDLTGSLFLQSAFNPFNPDVSRLALELINWGSLDSYVVHLYRSNLGPAFFDRDLFKQNIQNLRNFINP